MNIPNMIYGTAWKKEATSNLVYEAIKQGFKGVDTACQPRHYREDLVGLGLEKAYTEGLIKREDIFLQTKFTPIGGQDLDNMPYLQNDDVVTQLEKSFLKSKENLKTNFIDSYVLHSPIFPITDLVKVYRKMEDLELSNEVGQIGISNCYDIKLLIYLYDIAKVKPKVVQNRFYKDSNYDKEIRLFCKQKGIIYESFWSLTANPHILSNEIVQNLAKKYQKSAEQIFYRFLNHLDIVPLNGTTSVSHMIEDLKIVEFTLLEDEIKDISKLLD